MSQIQTLLQHLNDYNALAHHHDANLMTALDAIQSWQRRRIHQTHQGLFTNPKTAPLIHFLIDRIYDHTTFDTISKQLQTATNKAVDGSGRLKKLIPNKALDAGLIGIDAAIDAIKLDLALAKIYVTAYKDMPINDELMTRLYQAGNDKSERIRQIQNIGEACHISYQQFNSFLLQKAFKLAKSTAYNNGYQPLYDFIHDGLHAIATIDNIGSFCSSFMTTELTAIEQIYGSQSISGAVIMRDT